MIQVIVLTQVWLQCQAIWISAIVFANPVTSFIEGGKAAQYILQQETTMTLLYVR